MPRIDYQVETEQVLSYEMQMVLTLLLSEINALRVQAGLAPRTTAQMRTTVRSYLKTHPMSGQGN